MHRKGSWPSLICPPPEWVQRCSLRKVPPQKGSARYNSVDASGSPPGSPGSNPAAPVWSRGQNNASVAPRPGRAERLGSGALPRRAGACQRADMALYVDDAIWRWQGLRWAHLLADDIDELHRFATGLGIHRLSYQGPPRTSVPHYDLTAYERRRAIAGGAIACSRDEIVAVLRRSRWNYRLAQTMVTRNVVELGLLPQRAPLARGTSG
ncbi:MAG TPA: DUF4031 domain-containing protein [Xanthobacteraceae bacterium]|nr:DUF4031 domain-containing protein [Xanthobacteraceae bacterium]